MIEKLQLYINENLVVENRMLARGMGNYYYLEDNNVNKEKRNFKTTLMENAVNINDFIKQKEDYNNFQSLLFKMIDERNLKDSDVYNRVHIDRRLFSKIRNENYHPSKETIILLGIALELSEKEIDELLESASYSLPKNNHYDLIIRFCFINKIFKLNEINELLDKYKCKLFSY
jgi:hypothetical protein